MTQKEKNKPGISTDIMVYFEDYSFLIGKEQSI